MLLFELDGNGELTHKGDPAAGWTRRDYQLVAADLGRPPRGVVGVAARCSCGHPLVVITEPRLPDGTPFPTTYYLTDSTLAAACSRLEADHLMERYNDLLAKDALLAEAYALAHQDYLAAREHLGEVPEIQGVSAGGMPTRVKCLHALVAHSLAAGPGVNPIGDFALQELRDRGEWSQGVCFGHTEPEDSKTVAAIDCGTNSIRLLIAETGPGFLRDLVREMVITRLGQGVDQAGVLDPEAIERTLSAARIYAQQLQQNDVQAARFVTTSASRDAANRDDFLVPIEEITGLVPQVLSGTEEAELSFKGALSALPEGLEPPYLLVDIGGGSTEFVLGTEHADQAVSIDMGSVRVTERFGGDPWTPEKVRAARKWISEQIDAAAGVVDFDAVRTIVGVAGTVTTIGALIAGVEQYDPAKVHGQIPSQEEWRRSISFMVNAPTLDKAALPFMPEGRADVIAGGSLIWEQVLSRFGVLDGDRVTAVISEHDILDGLALSLA